MTSIDFRGSCRSGHAILKEKRKKLFSYELLTFQSLLPPPSKGWGLNRKGLLNGTPTPINYIHLAPLAWRVQVGSSLLFWPTKTRFFLSGSGLCQRASSPLRDLCRGCRYAYVGTGGTVGMCRYLPANSKIENSNSNSKGRIYLSNLILPTASKIQTKNSLKEKRTV